jgi:hypothetical protein
MTPARISRAFPERGVRRERGGRTEGESAAQRGREVKGHVSVSRERGGGNRMGLRRGGSCLVIFTLPRGSAVSSAGTLARYGRS